MFFKKDNIEKDILKESLINSGLGSLYEAITLADSLEIDASDCIILSEESKDVILNKINNLKQEIQAKKDKVIEKRDTTVITGWITLITFIISLILKEIAIGRNDIGLMLITAIVGLVNLIQIIVLIVQASTFLVMHLKVKAALKNVKEKLINLDDNVSDKKISASIEKAIDSIDNLYKN